jgi:YggT family protein
MSLTGFYLLGILAFLLRLYSYAILADAILSFGFLPRSNPIVRFLYFITEPVVAPCRQVLNRILPARWRMRFDFSPVLAMILVQVVEWLVRLAQASIY